MFVNTIMYPIFVMSSVPDVSSDCTWLQKHLLKRCLMETPISFSQAIQFISTTIEPIHICPSLKFNVGYILKLFSNVRKTWNPVGSVLVSYMRTALCFLTDMCAGYISVSHLIFLVWFSFSVLQTMEKREPGFIFLLWTTGGMCPT